MQLIAEEACQIRHTALEAARISILEVISFPFVTITLHGVGSFIEAFFNASFMVFALPLS